jgi:hypothetical protein
VPDHSCGSTASISRRTRHLSSDIACKRLGESFDPQKLFDGMHPLALALAGLAQKPVKYNRKTAIKT